MPVPDPQKIIAFATAEELGLWLSRNHAVERELWVKIFKKNTGIPSVVWEDVVSESLCWGWIDGIRKSLDEQAYLQRITPRGPRSIWSKKNTEHTERLIAEGRMQEPGLIHVHAAKADGRWDKAYCVSDMEIPADFIEALESKPEAKQFLATLPKSSRSLIAFRLADAKKPETRQARSEKFLTMLSHGEKPR
ncbi:MAG: YdeI/OmpD-associated family protein [Saccharospirillaceae bacterium]|nr:YdeI/OmpD-associated family protein [Saccharospirillaceae bacterium]MCD8533008.1 YdeI/OmpD-associated family protein [Saccharospirillaceae bacterium]